VTPYYDTHLRKFRDLAGAEHLRMLEGLLSDARGTRVLLRILQGGTKIDIERPSGDLAAALRASGVAPERPFHAEVVVRRPASPSEPGAPGSGDYRDRHDWNALQWNGERGTGEPLGPSPFRPTPMFFRENGSTVDLVDLYRSEQGSSVFLILNGHSFDEGQRALLRNRPGVLTFGVNNGAHGFRTDFWTCVDDPTRFLRSIWEDGRIQKFVPMAHFEKRIWDRGDPGDEGTGSLSRERVKHFPNVVGYRRNEAFQAEQWLHEDTVNWGNHKSRGGGRSVMLVALRIAHLLGFRRVYLVGCDFEMSAEHRYWFPEDRSGAAIRNNQNSYRILAGYFDALKPEFEKAGLEVINCNPQSQLRTFPFADLAAAAASAEVDASASTVGMYVDRHKEAPSPPRPAEVSSRDDARPAPSPARSPDALAARVSRRAGLPDLLTGLDLLRTGVELGVAGGSFSRRILSNCALRCLYSVDAWAGDRSHDLSEYAKAARSLAKFGERSILLRSRFDEALPLFADASLDFVYVDGYAHGGNEGGATLDDWWPKVRAGGIFAGHDYSAAWPRNVEAVDAFLLRNRIDRRKLHLTSADAHPSWILLKPE